MIALLKERIVQLSAQAYESSNTAFRPTFHNSSLVRRTIEGKLPIE